MCLSHRGHAIGERLKENEISQMTCFSVSLILKHKIMLIIWEPCLCCCFLFLGRNICNIPLEVNKKGLLCQVNMCIKLFDALWRYFFNCFLSIFFCHRFLNVEIAREQVSMTSVNKIITLAITTLGERSPAMAISPVTLGLLAFLYCSTMFLK